MPKKCNVCALKKIKAAYRSLCDDCATGAGKCPGCAEVQTQLTSSGAEEPGSSGSAVHLDSEAADVEDGDEPVQDTKDEE